MNFYKRFPGDYLRDTMQLTMTEDGAYTRLLDWCYANERPLPKSMSELYRIARTTSRNEQNSVRKVIAIFFVERPDGWHQERTEETILKHRETSKKHRDEGRRGGRPPSQYDNQTKTNLDIEGATKLDKKSKPITTSHQPSKDKEQKHPALPDWVVPDIWGEWLEHRKTLRAPVGAGAAVRLLRTLGRLRESGHDPTAVIERSIEHGWKGFFPLEGDKSGHRGSQFESRIAESERVAGALTGYKPGRTIPPD